MKSLYTSFNVVGRIGIKLWGRNSTQTLRKKFLVQIHKIKTLEKKIEHLNIKKNEWRHVFKESLYTKFQCNRTHREKVMGQELHLPLMRKI